MNSSHITSCVRYFFYGVCTGIADILPGISGGTVAFLFGFYHRLLTVFSHIPQIVLACVYKNWRKARELADLSFAIPLFFGDGIAICCFAWIVDAVINDPTLRLVMVSFFSGLLLASIQRCASTIKRYTPSAWLLLSTACLSSFILSNQHLLKQIPEGRYELMLEPITGRKLPSEELYNYSPTTRSISRVGAGEIALLYRQGWVNHDTEVYQSGEEPRLVEDFIDDSTSVSLGIVAAGMGAALAFLLPGTSGTTVLQICGYYPTMLAAVADLVEAVVQRHWPNPNSVEFIWQLALGAVFGLIVLSKIVTIALQRFHTATMAFLVGAMIGSLPILWPFITAVYRLDPAHIDRGARLMVIERNAPPISLETLFAIGVCFLGYFFVYAIENRKASVELSVGRPRTADHPQTVR